MIWILVACTTEQPAEPPVEPAPPAADPAKLEAAREAATAEAEAAAAALTGALKNTLMEAMKDGPGAAVSACADQAQGTAALALAGKKARAGRTSTRLRSPVNKAPEWVAPWLAQYGDGALADAVSSTTHQEGEGTVTARVIRPLEVKPLCLTCHGDPATIPPEVTAVLAERYPNDAATGYAAGDLRGAVWAEATVPMEP